MFVLAFDEPLAFAFGPVVIAEMAERHRQCECRVEVGAGHIGRELGVAEAERTPVSARGGEDWPLSSSTPAIPTWVEQATRVCAMRVRRAS